MHASGIPHLDFFKGMEREHCHGKLSNHSFKSANFKIETCPAKEWAYVLGKEGCPASQMIEGRRMPSIERLMELDETVKAKLIQAEIIAVVLYTGPMVNSDFALVMKILV